MSTKFVIELGKKTTLTTRAMEAWRLSFSSIFKKCRAKTCEGRFGLGKTWGKLEIGGANQDLARRAKRGPILAKGAPSKKCAFLVERGAC